MQIAIKRIAAIAALVLSSLGAFAAEPVKHIGIYVTRKRNEAGAKFCWK